MFSFKKTLLELFNSFISILCIFLTLFSNKHLTNGSEFVPNVTCVKMVKFFLNPIFPPSGVSYGQIVPNEVACKE